MKILFITLSNIGDVILTLPALDSLRENFPDAHVTVMSGPRPKEIFENNPKIHRLIIYDKHQGLKGNIGLYRRLYKEKFDLIVDLRNSFFGAFLPAKYKTSVFLPVPKNVRHMKEKHLYKLRTLKLKLWTQEPQEKSLCIKPEDEEYINGILKENNIITQDKIIVLAPGARSHIKRWSADKFLELAEDLREEFKAKIVLAGDKEDAAIAKYIAGNSRYPILDLTGKTGLLELACLLKNAACVITNDSAVLHLASYLNIPVVAVFGPTNEEKYGPWSINSRVVKKDIFCRPCEKALCRFMDFKCMQVVKVEDVFRATEELIKGWGLRVRDYEDDFERILIVRTDRIGDVLLSTPVIKALREEYPHAYIAMMVSPYAKDIVDGNPYLDEVIIYDKDAKHHSWIRSMKFARNLKKKRFDLTLILHPTNRVHLVAFFAGIKRRVGYDRKLGFLLTDRIKHTKHLGEKHEVEYNLDLVKYLGIEPEDKGLFMPIKEESEEWLKELFKKEKIKEGDKLLAIHPGASCPSKVWPAARFSEAADKLAKKYGFKILLIAGPKDIATARVVAEGMRHPLINLAGKTSVSQLASLLKRCRLFISNDSGPVHIASAVGAPVISIFGRNQKGLSPRRWGPVGLEDRFLHKEVGCIECLAHNCVKEFTCLKAITVGDVLKAAQATLEN